MTYIFYLLAILPILFELMVLKNPKKIINFTKSFKKKDNEERRDMNKYEIAFVLLQLGYFIWNFIGLFSSQWVLFGCIFILSIIPKGNYLFVRRIDALLTLGLLFFILINRFHLHVSIF